MLSVASCNVTSLTTSCVGILLRSHGLSIPPKGTTPEIVRSGLFAAHVSSTMPALCCHGILHMGSLPQRSSALCCILLSSLRLLAILVSTRPARFVKRLCALLVNLLFTTVFRSLLVYGTPPACGPLGPSTPPVWLLFAVRPLVSHLSFSLALLRRRPHACI